MKKSTLQHLRIPFSYFLLPVFLFGYSIDTNSPVLKFWIVFFILHFLIYPASNGYNSYFDQDEGSIGGLRNPPKATRQLYFVSLLLDVIGIALALLLINIYFAAAILVYGLISKAYSHPAIRLKKYPYLSWIVAGTFQGWFTLIMVFTGLHDGDLNVFSNTEVQLAGLLSSAMLMGSYPMTQIYQHREDTQRGDITLSIKLGIRGTFHFTAIFFFAATLGYLLFYNTYASLSTGLFFFVFMSPVVFYFASWYLKVRKDPGEANFENTMRLNMISSTSLTLFFLAVAFGLI